VLTTTAAVVQTLTEDTGCTQAAATLVPAVAVNVAVPASLTS
jgi:hypothetical protein